MSAKASPSRLNSYIGMLVISRPIPKPAMNLATMNMAASTEAAERAPPIMRMAAPNWIVRFLPAKFANLASVNTWEQDDNFESRTMP